MKLHLPIILLACAALTTLTHAQEKFQTPALLVDKQGGYRTVWLTAATKSLVRYRDTKTSMDVTDSRISEFSAVYLLEPEALSQALDLYENRKYKEARGEFAKIKEDFKPIRMINDNPGVIAAFYEMECMRKTGDLDALAKEMSNFIKDPLTCEIKQRQLELYALWEASRSKSWDRLEILVRKYDEVKLTGDQRAQVAYLEGLALEGLGRPNEALFAYNTVMTADANSSEDIAGKAALRVMAIHMTDPEVKQAMKVWGTEDENKNSRGYDHLLEASAVASIYKIFLGSGAPLPDEFEDLVKYKSAAPTTADPES